MLKCSRSLFRYSSAIQFFTSRARIHYNKLSSIDVDYFKEILSTNFVKEEDLDAYNTDWLHSYKGNSRLALQPRTTEHVSKILSYCNERLLPIVIQAGNTSLVAGSVPENDEIILLLSKMNKVESFNSKTGVLICQAGCILHTLEEYVNQSGYIMPYDLGAKGSCQIGGNLATNAAGLHFVRYGSLHGNVLGLEVVQANGDIVNLMSTMRKDNTGYDLKQLYIGSEGTLGVITRVAILCPIRPKAKIVALFALNSFEAVVNVLLQTRANLGEYISAFEMFDEQCMQALNENSNMSKPFDSKFYILLELVSSNQEQLENQLNPFLSNQIENGNIVDGTYTSELSQMEKIWSYRERIPESLLKDGYCYKYDVSLPLENFYQLVELMREKLSGTDAMRICGYGHVADFNIHFNVTSKKFSKKLFDSIEPGLYEWISEKGGSISAEHGLGLKKRNYIHLSKTKEAVELMKNIKNLLDPNCILNPKKLLPD